VGKVGARGRRAAAVLVPAVVCVAAFGYGLPKLAPYHGVLGTFRELTSSWAVVVLAAAAVNLLANWVFIAAAIPGLPLQGAAK
jgi:hypothetical protein